MRDVAAEPAPGDGAWDGFDRDDFPDGVAYEVFFGKTAVEAQALFHSTPMNSIEELQVVPDAAFSYYFLALADYPKSPKSRGNCVAASAYMWMLEQEIGDRQRPISREDVSNLFDVAVYLAENQGEYNAPPEDFGVFVDKIETLRTKLKL